MRLHLMALAVSQACREIGQAWIAQQRLLNYIEERKGASNGDQEKH